MDSKLIRKEIARLVEEISRHEAVTGNAEHPVGQQQVEQLAKKIHQLNEKAIVLSYLYSLQAAVERGEISAMPEVKVVKEPELIRRGAEAKKPEEPVQPIKLEEAIEVTGGINEEQVQMPGDEKSLTPSVTTEEKKSEPKPEVKEQAKPATSTEAPKMQKQAEIDLFAGELPPVQKPVVKEAPKEKPKLQAEDKSLARKLQKKPIADLKAAIGINEKFLFINELFGGNMTEYNIAINQVNICSSHAEAEAYLGTLRGLYKWDPESETVITFSELVERRFL